MASILRLEGSHKELTPCHRLLSAVRTSGLISSCITDMPQTNECGTARPIPSYFTIDIRISFGTIPSCQH